MAYNATLARIARCSAIQRRVAPASPQDPSGRPRNQYRDLGTGPAPAAHPTLPPSVAPDGGPEGLRELVFVLTPISQLDGFLRIDVLGVSARLFGVLVKS